MAAPDAKATPDTDTAGTGLVVGLVSARWNDDIVSELTAGALRAITASGATPHLVGVAGAFELPFAARVLAESGEVDAIVVVGCVIRGETTHYELVSEGCAEGVMRVQLDWGVPIGLGVVTVENHEQAVARSGGPGDHNVGEDAAWAAVELADLRRRLLPEPTRGSAGDGTI